MAGMKYTASDQPEQLTMNNLILIAMLLALIIPIYEAWKDENIWQTMLAFPVSPVKQRLLPLSSPSCVMIG